MSVQNLPPNPETETEPEGLTIRRLVRAIDYAEGFWLGFAKSNTPAQRRRLAALCKDLLEPLKIRVLEIELKEPVTDLLPVLRERLAQEAASNEEKTTQPKLAIFVHGLERSIPSREAYPPLLSALNLKRELFRQEVPNPLLLWLPDYALTALARKAPDFWAWRSGLYEFAPERESAKQMLDIVYGEALHITASLSEQAKRERLVMLKGLLDDYRELGNNPHEQQARANILNEIGLTQEVLGEWLEAKQAYEESLNIWRKLNHGSGEAIALHNLGGIAYDRGELDEARRLYGESLEIKRRLDDQPGIAATLHQMGMLAQDRGGLEEARRLYEECLEIKQRVGDQGAVANTLHELGRLAQAQGELEEARRLYSESLEIKQKNGDQRGVAYTFGQLGNLALDQGAVEEAQRLYGDCLKISRNIGDQISMANALHQLAMLAQSQGELEEAQRLYGESLEIYKKAGNQSDVAETLYQLGKLAKDAEDGTKAAQLFREALAIFERIGSPYADVTRKNLAVVENRGNVSD
jgi:tetratricopeptide (TPR) repeat protein